MRTLTYDVPTAQGIYALWKDGEIVYIGKAQNIRTQIYGHQTRRMEYDGATYFYSKWFYDDLHPFDQYRELPRLVQLFILLYNPRLNTQGAANAAGDTRTNEIMARHARACLIELGYDPPVIGEPIKEQPTLERLSAAQVTKRTRMAAQYMQTLRDAAARAYALQYWEHLRVETAMAPPPVEGSDVIRARLDGIWVTGQYARLKT